MGCRDTSFKDLTCSYKVRESDDNLQGLFKNEEKNGMVESRRIKEKRGEGEHRQISVILIIMVKN